MEYPFIKCLNPRRIVNPYTNEPVIVPCEKCEACLLQKSSMRSLKCKLESMSHKFCYFVTLTYSNDYVPLLYPESVVFNDQPRTMYYTGEYDEPFVITDSTSKDTVLLQDKCNMEGAIPYLRKSDAQKFMKRLRINYERLMLKYISDNVEKYTKQLLVAQKLNKPIHIINSIKKKISDLYEINIEKIRYYCVGEYGPVHYRPHFHLLLWFENEISLSKIGEAIYKSWSFGRIDFSLSRGSASSYTAGYVNSTINLPKVFTLPETKPFALHSNKLGEAILEKSKEEVYSMQPKRFVENFLSIDGVNTKFNLWRSFTALYYPKCKDYDRKSPCERLYSYQIHAVASRWLGETKPYQQTKLIVDTIIGSFGFDFGSYDYQFGSEVGNLIRYLHSSMCINTSPFKKNLVYFDHVQENDLLDFKKYLFNIIYHELYISYRFTNYCCDFRYTPTRVLDLIDQFYKSLNYDLLKRQLEFQSQFIDESLINLHDIYYMYNNTDVVFKYDPDTHTLHYGDKFKSTLVYKRYHAEVKERFENSIKHKTLNDKNKVFHNR